VADLHLFFNCSPLDDLRSRPDDDRPDEQRKRADRDPVMKNYRPFLRIQDGGRMNLHVLADEHAMLCLGQPLC